MLLEAKDLKKLYTRGQEDVAALKGVSLGIDRGEFISIMGPSGSGKSTLMHCMGGLDRPSHGSIIIEGKALEKFSDQDLSVFRRRRLGFIFQFFNLVQTLSALENIMLPLLLDGEPSRKIEPRARELLRLVGIEKRANHMPTELSGGEMQRVAIARALIAEPVLLLADEPTGNLDSKNGQAVLTLLQTITKEKGHTIVMVTHDPNAAVYGNRIVRLKDGLIESDERKAFGA